MTDQPPPGLDEDVPLTTMNRLPSGVRTLPRWAHFLEQTAGPGSPRRHELSLDMLIVGRGASVDVRVDSNDVSRTHARLQRVDDEYSIEDLDSRNGVFLNGVRVHAAVLRDGDSVQLGDAVFTYTEGT